ncbi:MAG: TIGR00730 family Rossman fold protein [Candidatus Margulisbacteria bacterium]|nr:TIGR00730 family Rossman fold protein [Candidatus Margulisiibacteriota bacterium]
MAIHPKTQKFIQEFVDEYGKDNNEKYLADALFSLIKMAKEHHDSLDWRLIRTFLNELRDSFKVFTPYRDIRKVCMFGSARTKPQDPEYKMAELFAKKITHEKYMVITGAGSGIMEAGNKGAHKDKSFGVNINLPFEQDANPYIAFDTKLVSYKYFFTRKLMFTKESDAAVLFPGGFGTLDEGFESLTLIQTGKSKPRPVLLMSTPDNMFWEQWVKTIKKQLLEQGLISEQDLKLFKIVKNVDEAVNIILNFHRIYHSVIFSDGYCIIRLNQSLSDNNIQELNDLYKDIIISGKITSAGPLPIEKRFKEFLDKPRLGFNFDNFSFGRLTQMIDTINQF